MSTLQRSETNRLLRAGALTRRPPAAPDRRRGRLRCAVARYVGGFRTPPRGWGIDASGV